MSTSDEELLAAEAKRALLQLKSVRLLVRKLVAEKKLDGDVAKVLLAAAVVGRNQG